MTVGVIIPAGGRGLRLGEALPKQFLEVESGWPLLRYALETFHALPEVSSIVLVLPPEWLDRYTNWKSRYAKLKLASGGAERWLSVKHGFDALPAECDAILIHDAARPFVNAAQIQACIDRVNQGMCCTLAQPCVDTIKRVKGSTIVETLDRRELIAVQTPQGFSRQALEIMYAHAESIEGQLPTDECMLAEAAGLQVEWVMGGENARKITQAEDFRWACEFAASLNIQRTDRTPNTLAARKSAMFKTGIGQDSHRILDGEAHHAQLPLRPLLLAGIALPVDFSLVGNSDSDVVLHAITNAISGITCRPILGPVADALCKQGITDSKAYLDLAMADLKAMEYRLTHISVTLECQRPKLIAHFPAMRAKLAEFLGLALIDIALTATSGEGLTDFGKGEGVQAFAVASAIDAIQFPVR